MANNDEAGGSGGKAFWELSQEMEDQPRVPRNRYTLNDDNLT